MLLQSSGEESNTHEYGIKEYTGIGCMAGGIEEARTSKQTDFGTTHNERCQLNDCRIHNQ